MKTAISIPDNLYNDAEIKAKQLGLARSQLYVKAIKEFLENHNKDQITEKLNSVYGTTSQNNQPENQKASDISDIGVDSLRKTTENDTW